jgi:FkbM family methyltransferase
MQKSYSQYNQEEFVLKYHNNKTNGVFIELGGLDGLRHSNTYLLENKYKWNGLIIEPSPTLYNELIKNRNVNTENILVGDNIQQDVEFLHIENKDKCIGLQGIKQQYNSKHLSRIMKELNYDNNSYNIININMTTLQNLCNKYNLTHIDYLSLDVEGSELIVLKGIDFKKSNIKLIGVEINYEDDKKEIFDILLKNGYKFIKKQGDYFFEKQ